MMAYGAFTQKQYSWLFSSLLIAALILTIYFDMVENVRAVFWGGVFFFGVLWSGKEMILSIDFDKPFLISFYWSTLGYLTLTVLLVLLTSLAFIQASKDYCFDKDCIQNSHE